MIRPVKRRFKSTGELTNTSSASSVTNNAYLWNQYLKREMSKLQNKARQWLFRAKHKRKPCIICGECDVSAFFVDYNEPQYMWLCQKCHKEHSQMRGSIYDQLKRHGVPVISWEDWKNGLRPVVTKSKD